MMNKRKAAAIPSSYCIWSALVRQEISHVVKTFEMVQCRILKGRPCAASSRKYDELTTCDQLWPDRCDCGLQKLMLMFKISLVICNDWCHDMFVSLRAAIC